MVTFKNREALFNVTLVISEEQINFGRFRIDEKIDVSEWCVQKQHE